MSSGCPLVTQSSHRLQSKQGSAGPPAEPPCKVVSDASGQHATRAPVGLWPPSAPTPPLPWDGCAWQFSRQTSRPPSARPTDHSHSSKAPALPSSVGDEQRPSRPPETTAREQTGPRPSGPCPGSRRISHQDLATQGDPGKHLECLSFSLKGKLLFPPWSSVFPNPRLFLVYFSGALNNFTRESVPALSNVWGWPSRGTGLIIMLFFIRLPLCGAHSVLWNRASLGAAFPTGPASQDRRESWCPEANYLVFSHWESQRGTQ